MKKLLLFSVISVLFFSCGGSTEPETNEVDDLKDKQVERKKKRRKGGAKNKGNAEGKANKKQGKRRKAKGGDGGGGGNPTAAYENWSTSFTDTEVNQYFISNKTHACFSDILGTIDHGSATDITGCDWKYKVKNCVLPSNYPYGEYEDVLYLDKTLDSAEHQYELWAVITGKYDASTVEIRKFKVNCMRNSGTYDLILSAEEDASQTENALVVGISIPKPQVPSAGQGLVFRFEEKKKKSRKLFSGTIEKGKR